MQIDYGKRIFGLDLMRAVAILLVVVSHIFWITPNAKGVIPDLLSISGVIGVEIFFVLSGFLIGRILYKLYTTQDFTFKNVLYFWIRRWFRTLPNYYLALLINVLIIAYIGHKFPPNLWQYGLFLHNFAWEMPWFFAESWSLSIEEFAYIIGPLFLYLTLFIKTGISKSRMFLIVTILIIILFTLTKLFYNAQETIRDMRHWNVNLKNVVIYRIDSIYYGFLGAYLSIKIPQSWKRIRYIAFILGISIFLGLNILIPMKRLFITEYPTFWNVMYLPLNSIWILMTVPFLSTWRSENSMIVKPITYISLISYGMYLLHYSIILQLLKYYIPTESLAGFDIFVYILVYLLLTFVLAYLLYRFYEKPMMDLRDAPKIKKYFE